MAAESHAAFERMRKQAWRASRELRFTRPRLIFFAIKSLEYGCPFCEEMYGVDSLGIVWDVEPSAQMAQNFVIENVMVCCAMCAAGKGSLNGDEWLNFVMHIKSFDDDKAKRLRDALAKYGGPRG